MASLVYIHLSVFVALAGLSSLVRSQLNCSEMSICSECVQSVECVWCFSDSYPSNQSRCFSNDSPLVDSCAAGYLENPINNVSLTTLELNENNQVSLEFVDLKLRVGSSEAFTVSVRAAENFPLDLYLLMDLSGSFESDLITVKNVAPSLFSSLLDVTTQFRVGFGAFVDKPTPPFSSLSQLRSLVRPYGACSFLNQPDVIGNCSTPFSFEHLAPFTDDQSAFSSAIQNASISSTADNPEGALDAMLQATVCTDVIGWGENTRRVMLVITDALMHLAGDGSLAGINKPNDAACRTSFDQVTGRISYNASLEYDYPSVEQVRLALEEFGIFPVVAFGSLIGNNARVVLSNIFEEEFDAFTEDLESQSANLVSTIRDAYDRIVSQANLTYRAPSFLSVNVTPSCPENSSLEDLACVGIGNNTANFTVTVTLNECTDEVMNGVPYPLEVNVRGFDRFTVNIQGICSCECAQPEMVEENSTRCSGNGNYVCGVCECFEPYTGLMCECNPTLMCPIINDFECSGSARGTCDGCGNCNCEPRFSGPACECSNFGCDCNVREVACTSCTNGTEICECGADYFGDNCECSENNCRDPSNPGELCNGNGDCNACPPQAGCVCNPQTHFGTFCGFETESLSGCQGSQACIVCITDATDMGVNVSDVSDECAEIAENCSTYTAIDTVDDPDNHEIADTFGSTVECPLSTIQCQYTYFQGRSSLTGEFVFEVQPPSCLLIPWWTIPIIIVAGLFVLGVAILVVAQVILRWLDYRELKHFEKEVQEADFTKNVNPVYQAPTMTYDNPVHGKPM